MLGYNKGQKKYNILCTQQDEGADFRLEAVPTVFVKEWKKEQENAGGQGSGPQGDLSGRHREDKGGGILEANTKKAMGERIYETVYAYCQNQEQASKIRAAQPSSALAGRMALASPIRIQTTVWSMSSLSWHNTA